ncbi:hypothetical protein TNCV_2517481 [Trichonephila clavipes]|nr:hypothetical protein TNCV_2517481 [Trichonephila clavipes]
MRAFGDGACNFVPWASDEDDTLAVFSGTGLELIRSKPRSNTLTTRPMRPASHQKSRTLEGYKEHKTVYRGSHSTKPPINNQQKIIENIKKNCLQNKF